MRYLFVIMTSIIILNNGEIFRIINQYRGLNHLPALKESKLLSKTAKAKIQYGVLSHDNFSFIMKKHKVKAEITGENLAYGFKKENELVDRFMSSETHRDNILDKNFKYMGIDNDGSMVVVHFSN